MRDAEPLIGKTISIDDKKYVIYNFFWSQNKELYVSLSIDNKVFVNHLFDRISKYL